MKEVNVVIARQFKLCIGYLIKNNYVKKARKMQQISEWYLFLLLLLTLNFFISFLNSITVTPSPKCKEKDLTTTTILPTKNISCYSPS